MKLLKKSLLIALGALMCVLAAVSFAACGDKTTEGLEYAPIEENGSAVAYSVKGIGTATDAKIVIPSVYEGLPVTQIGKSAFYLAENITSVKIPSGVTAINSYAFYGCVNLREVTIPEGVTLIGTAAFNECTSLTSVTIPGSVKSMETMAFSKCTSLKTVNIKEGVPRVGVQAFIGCTSLTSVSVPDSVTAFDMQAFSGCSSLKSVKIPSSVTYIGYKAFENCTSLGSATFADTEGWKATIPLSDTTVNVSADKLSSPSDAANLLAITYVNYTWDKG